MQPYCGAPPIPGGVAWTLDPWLALALAVGLAVLSPLARDRRALLAGWGLAALLLLSPLCTISVALFSARVGQHVLLLTLAAPLLARGLAGRVALRPGGAAGLAAAVGCFALVLWAWHLPGPYALTFRSDAAYWAMQVSLLGAAIWLWHGLLTARADAALLAGLATAAQTGALGALLTFAARPLFAPHAGTTLAWGLTALEDQQLGGLLMWVPGGIAFALAALPPLARILQPAPPGPEAA